MRDSEADREERDVLTQMNYWITDKAYELAQHGVAADDALLLAEDLLRARIRRDLGDDTARRFDHLRRGQRARAGRALANRSRTPSAAGGD